MVGVDDLWARHADPMKALQARTSDATIVLCHNPDTLDVLPWGKGEWRRQSSVMRGQGTDARPAIVLAAEPPELTWELAIAVIRRSYRSMIGRTVVQCP